MLAIEMPTSWGYSSQMNKGQEKKIPLNVCDLFQLRAIVCAVSTQPPAYGSEAVTIVKSWGTMFTDVYRQYFLIVSGLTESKSADLL